jgi:CheY-like chemotaxis protein
MMVDGGVEEARAMDGDKQAAGRPTGLRVLIVEDDFLVSLLLEDMLAELGHQIVGPASDVANALELAHSEQMDIAVLDVNLRGAETYPIAAALAARAVPFIFATGYGRHSLREPYGDAPLLKKPFQQSDLEKLLADTFEAAHGDRSGNVGESPREAS